MLVSQLKPPNLIWGIEKGGLVAPDNDSDDCLANVSAMPCPIPDVSPTKMATGVWDGEKAALEARIAASEGLCMNNKDSMFITRRLLRVVSHEIVCRHWSSTVIAG